MVFLILFQVFVVFLYIIVEWWRTTEFYKVQLRALLLLDTTHITTCHVMLLLLSVPMYTPLSTTQKLAHTILVAIVSRTHAGLAIAAFKDLVTVAQENSTNQTADMLFGLGSNCPGERMPQNYHIELSVSHSFYL